MDEERKIFLTEKYKEMPEKELADMLRFDENGYKEEGVYALLLNAAKERGIEAPQRRAAAPPPALDEIIPSVPEKTRKVGPIAWIFAGGIGRDSGPGKWLTTWGQYGLLFGAIKTYLALRGVINPEIEMRLTLLLIAWVCVSVALVVAGYIIYSKSFDDESGGSTNASPGSPQT